MSDPKLVGSVLKLPPGWYELGEELKRRDKDPEWQARYAREDFLEAKALFEKQLWVVESASMGNYGQEARTIAEHAKGNRIRMSEAVDKLRELSIKGQVHRSDGFRPPSPVKLSDEQYRRLLAQQERIGQYDPAEDWQR